jgi:hypothetical protein
MRAFFHHKVDKEHKRHGVLEKMKLAASNWQQAATFDWW